jgi:hypothetical protein
MPKLSPGFDTVFEFFKNNMRLNAIGALFNLQVKNLYMENWLGNVIYSISTLPHGLIEYS